MNDNMWDNEGATGFLSVMPVQVLKCIDKDKDGKLTETDLMGVLFVPLKGATGSQSKEE